MPFALGLLDNSDALDILPMQSLCELLLYDSNEWQDKQHQKHEELLTNLQTCIWSDNPSGVEQQREITSFFFQKLKVSNEKDHDRVIQCFKFVFAQQRVDSATKTSEKDLPFVVEEILPTYKFLFSCLPSIPNFDVLKVFIATDMRESMMHETKVELVAAYMLFVAYHCTPDDVDIQELTTITQDFASLLVDRPPIVNQILPMNNQIHSELKNATVSAIAKVFYLYLSRVQEPMSADISWSNTQAHVLLNWADNQSATMYVFVAQAMFILLTCKRPSDAEHYDLLMKEFFSESHGPPRAYLVDTSEEALLFPDWLRLRMLRAPNERIVETALTDLEPEQLVLFVQSFGISIQAMSKLLQDLDKVATENPDSLRAVVADQSYLATLIEAQHMRGVTGGEQFRILIDSNAAGDDVEMEEQDLLPTCEPGELDEISGEAQIDVAALFKPDLNFVARPPVVKYTVS